MTTQKSAAHLAASNPKTSLKLVQIGNSFGVRLPKPMLNKYGIEHSVVVEQRPDGILLRGSMSSKATLEQTFIEMASAQENWSDFDTSVADGLDKLVW